MSKKVDSQVAEVVFDYLMKQNRPYSTVDIFNNLHNKHGKTAVQKALDQLVNDKKAIEKCYGKQKVYVVNQDLMATVSDSELKAMNSKISELNAKLTEKGKILKETETELQQLNLSLTTKLAKSQADDLEKELETLNKKLSILADNPNLVTPEDKKLITIKREKNVNEWRKRRRCADDMLNAILESYPKGKKFLYEEIGVETDDDIGVKLPV